MLPRNRPITYCLLRVSYFFAFSLILFFFSSFSFLSTSFKLFFLVILSFTLMYVSVKCCVSLSRYQIPACSSDRPGCTPTCMLTQARNNDVFRPRRCSPKLLPFLFFLVIKTWRERTNTLILYSRASKRGEKNTFTTF